MDEKDSSWQSNQFNASVSSTSGAQTSQGVTVMASTMLSSQAGVDQLQPGQEYQVVAQGHQVALQQSQTRAQPAQSSSDAFHRLDEVVYFILHHNLLRLNFFRSLYFFCLTGTVFSQYFFLSYYLLDCQ